MGSVSVSEIFSIGIGPSSSHTVGPMRAARRFLHALFEREFVEDTARIAIELYGSLAMTGKGHATDLAVMLGLEGETPEGVEPTSVLRRIEEISSSKTLRLFGKQKISFDPETDIEYHKGKRLQLHSNALRFKSFGSDGSLLHAQLYYSVGGGFIVDHEEALNGPKPSKKPSVPFPYKTAEELLAHCSRQGKAIWEIVLENEKTHRTEEETRAIIFRIWDFVLRV